MLNLFIVIVVLSAFLFVNLIIAYQRPCYQFNINNNFVYLFLFLYASYHWPRIHYITQACHIAYKSLLSEPPEFWNYSCEFTCLDLAADFSQILNIKSTKLALFY